MKRQEQEQINLEVQKCFNKIQKEQANEFFQSKAAESQTGHRVSQSDPQLGNGAGNEQCWVNWRAVLINAEESTVPQETQVP